MKLNMPAFSNYNQISNINSLKKTPIISFKQGQENPLDPLKQDKLVIRTSKEGLVKKNSFLHPNLELRDKGEETKGVFATGPINKGEIVCIFVGDIFTRAELEKLPMDLQCRTLQLAPDIYQLASKDPKNKEAFDAAEFFNHSCEPSLFLTGNNVLIAAKDIKAGEELTYDYGTSDTKGNPDTLAGWKCNCGAEDCRGENSPEAYRAIIAKLREKYGATRALDFVSDYIKKIYLNEINQ